MAECKVDVADNRLVDRAHHCHQHFDIPALEADQLHVAHRLQQNVELELVAVSASELPQLRPVAFHRYQEAVQTDVVVVCLTGMLTDRENL